MRNLILKLELPNGSQSCQQHQATLPTFDVGHAEWRQQSALSEHDASQKTTETLNMFSLVTSDDGWKFIIRGFQILLRQFCHCQFLSGHLVRVTVKPCSCTNKQQTTDSHSSMHQPTQKLRIDCQHLLTQCESGASTLPVRSIPSTWLPAQGL